MTRVRHGRVLCMYRYVYKMQMISRIPEVVKKIGEVRRPKAHNTITTITCAMIRAYAIVLNGLDP